MATLRIALAQINPTIGDIEGNLAKLAKWIAIGQLAALESQLVEDHACILDHFVGLYPAL